MSKFNPCFKEQSKNVITVEYEAGKLENWIIGQSYSQWCKTTGRNDGEIAKAVFNTVRTVAIDWLNSKAGKIVNYGRGLQKIDGKEQTAVDKIVRVSGVTATDEEKETDTKKRAEAKRKQAEKKAESEKQAASYEAVRSECVALAEDRKSMQEVIDKLSAQLAVANATIEDQENQLALAKFNESPVESVETVNA